MIKLGSFAKNVAILCSGTALGQLVVIAFSAVIARLYTPSALGQFSVYYNLVTILAPLVCLRYELAIPLPKKTASALQVVALTFLLLPVMSILVGGLIWWQKEEVASALKCDLIVNAVWMLPLLLTLTGSLQVISYWAIRQKRFGSVSSSRLLRSISITTSQLLLSSQQGLGLLVSQLLGTLAGALLLFRTLSTKIIQLRFRRRLAAALVIRHRNFPIYSALGGVVNSAGLGLPLILISSFHGPDSAGQYGMLQRLLAFPLILLGGAVAEVYLSEATQASRDGQLLPLFLKTSKRLAILSVAFSTAVLVAGPYSIEIFCGPTWAKAASWSPIVCIMFSAQLVASPVSQTFNVINMQHLQLAWDVFRLITVFAVFVFANQLHLSIRNTLIALTLAMVFAYVVLWLAQLISLRNRVRQNGQASSGM